LEQELSLAAAIQQSFLPVSFPWSPKYRSNARTVPAESVGGDFYDFIELPRDRLGIVIGDVAGRGIAAAVYMARAISEFRTAALRTDSPRDALERLNRQLLTRSTRGMFVTMTYLILDTSSGEVSYSSGGHLPALRRRGRSGAVEVLNEERGLPLGIAARPELDERHLTLETHDTLLLITDGVIEGLSCARADIAISKLLDMLRRQDSNHDQLVDTVFEEIAKLSPSQCPQDDMTVLSLAWLAERPSAPYS
jgi:sigma-B regulation protein RsbU (phosphoserine phosphatase)